MLLMPVVVSCLGQWWDAPILDRTVQTHSNTVWNDRLVWRQSVEMEILVPVWSQSAYYVHSLHARRIQRQGVQQNRLLSVQESCR